MRVYERKYSEFTYPEDMKKILDYLNERGKILVSEKTIENLWYDFSDEYCASWLCAHEDWLERFEEWLTNIEI